MTLRKCVLYHLGDKRHLAEDQGRATPLGHQHPQGDQAVWELLEFYYALPSWRMGGAEQWGRGRRVALLTNPRAQQKPQNQACAETERGAGWGLEPHTRRIALVWCPQKRKGLDTGQELSFAALWFQGRTYIPALPSKPLWVISKIVGKQKDAKTKKIGDGTPAVKVLKLESRWTGGCGSANSPQS